MTVQLWAAQKSLRKDEEEPFVQFNLHISLLHHFEGQFNYEFAVLHTHSVSQLEYTGQCVGMTGGF